MQFCVGDGEGRDACRLPVVKQVFPDTARSATNRTTSSSLGPPCVSPCRGASSPIWLSCGVDPAHCHVGRCCAHQFDKSSSLAQRQGFSREVGGMRDEVADNGPVIRVSLPQTVCSLRRIVRLRQANAGVTSAREGGATPDFFCALYVVCGSAPDLW